MCFDLTYSINHPIGTVSELTNFTFLYFNLLWKILCNFPNLLPRPLSKCKLEKSHSSRFLFQLIHQIRIVNQNRQVEKEKVSVRKSSFSSMYQSQISNVPSYFSLSAQTSNQNCKSESSGQKRKGIREKIFYLFYVPISNIQRIIILFSFSSNINSEL